jgi:hypothetical protein
MVDNRTFRRLFYQVLMHDPTHADMIVFFQHFQAALHMRGLTVHGTTTDGSPLYPAAIEAVFGPVPHQLCEFHILKDLNQAVLRAVAQVRKQLAEQQPHLKRGRPTREQRPLVHKRQRLHQTHRPALAKGQGHGQIADLFEYRHLFVQRHLTSAERATLQRITRGFPQLRALREIVEEVCRLFDRRCRTATALTKLARLRPTSNAVERGNRRYRKMQKTVYRVRTAHHIADRLALDLFREMAAQPRASTLALLHAKRTSPKSTR